MNSIKEKMHGTNNIPDLNALKIELENVKLEPPFIFEIDRSSSSFGIRKAYYSASNALLQCFDIILKYYEHGAIPNYASHHLQIPILAYHSWNICSEKILQQRTINIVNGPSPTQCSNIVELFHIKLAIKNAITLANDFIRQVREVDGNLASGLAAETRALKAAMSNLIVAMDLRPIGQDYPWRANAVILWQNDGLGVLITQRYNLFRDILFTTTPL